MNQKSMRNNQKHLSNIFLFWLPSLIILISVIVIIYGFSSIEVLKNYTEASTIAILLFWFPILMIFIDALVIVFGIIVLKKSIYAKLSFLISLLFWLPALNIFTSALAIVFGVVFFKELKEDGNQKGKGLAIAGITIGTITLILSLLAFIIYAFFPELLK